MFMNELPGFLHLPNGCCLLALFIPAPYFVDWFAPGA